jgi:VIT1/CCC1 family predicted Fe2+/Mn2+ transporter
MIHFSFVYRVTIPSVGRVRLMYRFVHASQVNRCLLLCKLLHRNSRFLMLIRAAIAVPNRLPIRSTRCECPRRSCDPNKAGGQVMSQTRHIETHFTGSETVRDIVIGMSDGLTVPFALAAGLSGAVASSGVIVTAGFAEIAAGSIAMGLGGYLAARSDADHYASERVREEREVVEKPDAEGEEVAAVFRGYGLGDPEIAPVLKAFQQNPTAWVDFMMRFELGLEPPHRGRARASALTIAGAYVAGGILPLAPYIVEHRAHEALGISVAVTLVALLIFGFVKGRFTGIKPGVSALQTTLVGGLAAAAAFALAKLIS